MPRRASPKISKPLGARLSLPTHSPHAQSGGGGVVDELGGELRSGDVDRVAAGNFGDLRCAAFGH